MSGATNECVLLIECQPDDAQLITNALSNYVQGAFAVESIIKLSDGLERIAKGGVRAVIVDIEKSNGRSVATIERLLTAAPHLPILILSAIENESVARQAVERGAHDYLLKSNFDNFRLRRAVRAMIEHRAADEQVCLYQQCAELALLCTGDAVVISDSSERVTHLNSAAELITGWSQKEAQGQPLSKIFGIVDGETRKVQTGEPRPTSEANRNISRTSSGSLLRRDGVELNIKNCTAHIRDRDGNISGMVAVFHDLGAARVKTLELSHQAQHDFLTGLPNRSLVNDRITQAISFARRYRKQLAVMFVDLDLFKRINDSLGHRRRGPITPRGGQPYRGLRAPFRYRGTPRR